MLLSLEISDILIIDRLALDFQPGLNVLTGETGAGKSILLDALGFVLGWRGRADLVRSGAQKGEVSAVFDISRNAQARNLLADAGLDVSQELILRRVNGRDGRKTAWINDRRVSGELLRKLSNALVELHGQQDDRGLLSPGMHREILDDYGRLGGDLEKTGKAWKGLKLARERLDAARSAFEEAQREEDYLRHALKELETLAPQAGEDESLDDRRRLMQAAEKIGEDVSRAQGAIGPEQAEGLLLDALRWLEGAALKAQGRLDAPVAAISRALNEVAEAQQGVEAAREALAFDPAELERVEERLFAIRAMARKHNILPDDLPAFQARLEHSIQALEQDGAGILQLESALEQAQADYEAAADQLSKRRHKAAQRLDAAMARELAPLKLGRAVFSTQISRGAPGPDGDDHVAFHVATNPGAPPGPLNKIASGGELSRFLLALKVCLMRGRAGDITMIFDEIDRGVGGATADAVGRRLEQVASNGQVLVVTHSPQVAARAAHHWRVEKNVQAGQTLSSVTALAPAQRVDEIARMLSGDAVTDEARAAARALLAG